MKKGRNLKLHLLTVLFLTFAVLETPFALVNAPRFQQWFLKTYKPFSPWQVSFDSLEVKPWRMRIDISHLSFVHPGGHTIFAETIKMRGSPLQLLRGRIGINSLFVHSPVITIAKSLVPKEEKPKKKFKIQTLIFLQNLVLKEGRVENVILHLPEQKKITVEEVQINLQPAAFFKGTGLGLNFHQIESTKPEDPGIRKVENLQIAVTTNFNSWSKTFPYIDNIDGDFQLKNAALDRLEIKNMEAQLRFEKGNLNSKKFSVQIGENVLLGRLETDLHSEKFHLDLETPKPITLPELESETRTFNTAGDLTTKINLDGQGFDLQKSAGKGSAGIIHLFQGFEDHPATVILQFDWQNAKLNLKEGKIGSDGAMVEATGIVDLKPVSFHLKMKAKDFPIQRFFEKFEDKNLHPIFGKGTVEGTLEGIGKTIHLQLKGETIEGGYGPVKAERAAVNLDLTYPQLKLDGRIFTGERNTGEAQFIINYGPKFSEYVPRTKKISLDAKFNGQPMASTLPGLPITGEADATFKLSGSPPLNLQGEGTLNVRQGSFMDESFELIETHFNLNSKRLIVDKADFTFPNSKSSSKKQLVMDFTPGGIRISGQTLAGFDIDLTHTSIDDRWQINKLTVEDPSDPTLKAKVTGSISPESMDLKGDGKIDLSRLKFLTKYIRDASGPAQFQLAVHGKSPDLNINGQITFDNNMLFLRVYPYAADELTGVVRFKGNRIETDLLAGLLGNGIFKIRGGMTHAQGKVSGFDGKVEGQQLYYRSEDGKFRMEYDADLTFKGTLQNPSVTGTLNILDGAYTKDFNIIEELKQAQTAEKEIRQAATQGGIPLKLDITVKNLGDLMIDNNVGRIGLATELHIGGVLGFPKIDGAVTVTEGEVHYLGLNFEITRGFIDFRDAYAYPYLEVDAEQDIGDAHITAKLHGRTNNLAMDLSGTSPQEGVLEKKDVLSLLLFGETTNERQQRSALNQEPLGSEIAAEQLARVLQRPIAGFTKLDIFRLEATPGEDGRVRRFELGKKINDRLSVELASELKQDDISQAFQLEYWLTDFFILKGSRSTDQSYSMGGGFKFLSR